MPQPLVSPSLALPVLACAALFALWQWEQMRHVATLSDLRRAEAQLAAAQAEIKGMRRAEARARDLLSAQSDLARHYQSKASSLAAAQAALQSRLDRLQNKEHHYALSAPFRRGTAAARRRTALLCPFFAAAGPCAPARADAHSPEPYPARAGQPLGAKHTGDAGDDR